MQLVPFTSLISGAIKSLTYKSSMGLLSLIASFSLYLWNVLTLIGM